jgi:uncharacterized protein (TIGR03083 family)
MTATKVLTGPRRSALHRDQAMRLAATEYQRFADVVAGLGPDDWTRPTDCPAWDVHQLVAHVVGMARMVATPVETVRQQRAAAARRPVGTPFIDSLTAHQVDRYAPLGPSGLTRLIADVGPKAARGRRRMPGFVRRRSLPEPEIVGGVPEPWTYGYLMDTILTRDTWMHRVDLCRATRQPMVLTPEHDGVLLADIVAEWADRHGRPYRLTLTGAAGGTWSWGESSPAPEVLELDAVEFARTLSGRRTDPTGSLLATSVAF